MNRQRRDIIKSAREHLNDAQQLVEMAYNEESDALDNMPESLEGTKRYEKMEMTVEMLEDVSSLIDEAIEKIDETLE